MKVFISVDMEGISGLVRWKDVGPAGIDFELNRSLMTADANAAIEGAFEAGATQVIVEENHGEVSYVADAEALQYRESLSISDEDFQFIEGAYEAMKDEEEEAVTDDV